MIQFTLYKWKQQIFFNLLVQIQKFCIFAVRKNRVRDVAQPGSALRSGRRGRKFESCHPDKKQLFWAVFFVYRLLFTVYGSDT